MFEWKQKQNLCWSAPYDKERASVNSENKYDYWSISEENQLLFVFMHRCRPSRWWEASTHRKFVQNSYNICVFKTWHDADRAISHARKAQAHSYILWRSVFYKYFCYKWSMHLFVETIYQVEKKLTCSGVWAIFDI